MPLTSTFSTIAASQTDPNSPLDTTLMEAIRQNIDVLYEWLGGPTYAPSTAHNHDGVNSRAIAGSIDLITTASTTFRPSVTGNHLVLLQAGGGAGGQGGSNVGSGGGGGGAGQFCAQIINLSTGTTYVITVGVGGSTADGSSSVFNSTFVARQGTGGGNGNSNGPASGGAGGVSGWAGQAGAAGAGGVAGNAGVGGTGGAGGNSAGTGGGGGGGGGPSPWGPGGDGAAGGASGNSGSSAATTTSIGYGAGGGGGGGSGAGSGISPNGAPGQSGICVIIIL